MKKYIIITITGSLSTDEDILLFTPINCSPNDECHIKNIIEQRQNFATIRGVAYIGLSPEEFATFEPILNEFKPNISATNKITAKFLDCSRDCGICWIAEICVKAEKFLYNFQYS